MTTGDRRTLCYALGGGLGHATRSLALLRKLAVRQPGTYCLLVNTPFAETIRCEVDRISGCELRILSNTITPQETARRVRQIFDELKPTDLIVDTFPRGLGGDLVPLIQREESVRKVLVSRCLPQEYIEGFGLREFVRDHFQLVIAPGETSPFEDCVPEYHRTSPFLIRDADELEPTADRHCALLVGSGTRDECKQMRNLHRELQTREPALDTHLALPPNLESKDAIHHFPLIEILPRYAAVIGSAGYNLVHETRALQIRSLLFPRERLYDNQRQRANSGLPNFEDVVTFIRETQLRNTTAAPDFVNGANEACDILIDAN